MESTEVKRAFAQRLHELCDDLGLPKARGRQTALAARFGVSTNAARKWLLGLGMPELELAIRIAGEARANVLWLLQGAGPKAEARADTTAGEVLAAVQHLPAADVQQVFDFIRYKIERSGGWFAAEQQAHYIAVLDSLRDTRKPAK